MAGDISVARKANEQPVTSGFVFQSRGIGKPSLAQELIGWLCEFFFFLTEDTVSHVSNIVG